MDRKTTSTNDDRFLSADEQLLKSGLFSDVQVICGDKTWKLHKNILCTRSSWFNKALNGAFEEARTGIVTIDDSQFKPEAVDWVIRYIYTGNFAIDSIRLGTKTNLVLCYEVYTVADYFAMDALATIAVDYFETELLSKAFAMQLRYNALHWLDEFFDVINEIYKNISPADTAATDPEKIASDRIRAGLIKFITATRFNLAANEQFGEFLETAPAFALEFYGCMRRAGDFRSQPPNAACSFCSVKPGRMNKLDHFAGLYRETQLAGACGTCAQKKALEEKRSEDLKQVPGGS
ncbi:POZ domain-containing protein [Echria macrotheca]|uniref:POZ domain-containing protein n=1 Tax=Echria macrotheca TaxID=438768 RepID=A0AAJ0B8Q8_9PEZI|nr:POZ domain-containing protein [Echria macrotheca]